MPAEISPAFDTSWDNSSAGIAGEGAEAYAGTAGRVNADAGGLPPPSQRAAPWAFRQALPIIRLPALYAGRENSRRKVGKNAPAGTTDDGSRKCRKPLSRIRDGPFLSVLIDVGPTTLPVRPRGASEFARGASRPGGLGGADVDLLAELASRGDRIARRLVLRYRRRAAIIPAPKQCPCSDPDVPTIAAAAY
jgi:hypothetical protein